VDFSSGLLWLQQFALEFDITRDTPPQFSMKIIKAALLLLTAIPVILGMLRHTSISFLRSSKIPKLSDITLKLEMKVANIMRHEDDKDRG
jgi:hypothetical protein